PAPEAPAPAESAPAPVPPQVPSAPAVTPTSPPVASALVHPSAASVAASLDASVDDSAVDETRLLPPRRERRGVVVTWDDGTQHVVTARAVFGRNPAPVAGAAVFAVADAT